MNNRNKKCVFTGWSASDTFEITGEGVSRKIPVSGSWKKQKSDSPLNAEEIEALGLYLSIEKLGFELVEMRRRQGELRFRIGKEIPKTPRKSRKKAEIKKAHEENDALDSMTDAMEKVLEMRESKSLSKP